MPLEKCETIDVGCSHGAIVSGRELALVRGPCLLLGIEGVVRVGEGREVDRASEVASRNVSALLAIGVKCILLAHIQLKLPIRPPERGSTAPDFIDESEMRSAARIEAEQHGESVVGRRPLDVDVPRCCCSLDHGRLASMAPTQQPDLLRIDRAQRHEIIPACASVLHASRVGIDCAGVPSSTAVILPFWIALRERGRSSRSEALHHQGDDALRGEFQRPLLDVVLQIGRAVGVRGIHSSIGPNSRASMHQDYGRVVGRTTAVMESCRRIQNPRERHAMRTREMNLARRRQHCIAAANGSC